MAKSRGGSAAWQHLYKRSRWLKLRDRQLSREPLCAYCLRAEDVTEATVVDHIKEHKGDEELFFDDSNVQSLCKRCHDSVKQREERGVERPAYGVDGYPL